MTEKLNLEELVQKFNDPLKPYSKYEVESNQEAKVELEKIATSLQSKSDTKTQEQALQHILELLKGGIQYYQGGDLKSLAPYIASTLSDMRPMLVRMASLVVAAEALVLEDDFIPSIEQIFPSLLKQLTSNNQSVAHSCHLALLNISKHCMNRKVARLFLSNAPSPIPAYRQIAAECAHIIIETWPPQLASMLSKEASAVVSTLLEDPVDTVRDIALLAAKINRAPNSSNKLSKPVSTLPFTPAMTSKTNPKRETPQKLSPKPKQENRTAIETGTTTPKQATAQPSTPSKSYGFSPSTTPRSTQKRSISKQKSDEKPELETISSSNTNQAAFFKKHLDQIIKNNDYSTLDSSKDTLAESVLLSIKEIPNFNKWESTLEPLFDHYKEIFEPCLIDIMSSFEFQEGVIDFAAKKVGIQNLAESLVKAGKPRITDSFNFFVSVFRLNKYQINITAPISKLLQSLIKLNSHNPNVGYIEKVLKSEPDNDIKVNLQKILFNLSNSDGNNSKWQKELETLHSSFFDSNSNQYVQYSPDPSANIPDSPSSSSSNLSPSKMAITPASKVATLFFSQNLPDLITNGDEGQRIACLNFITAAMPKLRSVSFVTSLKPIVSSLINEEENLSTESPEEEEVKKKPCSWHKNAIECISRMMGDTNTLSDSLIMISDSNEQIAEILLEALHQFTIFATPQKILAIHKVLIKKLETYMNNENLSIRHYTLSIFAECRNKIPKDFLYQMKKNFTPAQIRLIELKSGRYRKKNGNNA